jgi:hypothetical protein
MAEQCSMYGALLISNEYHCCVANLTTKVYQTSNICEQVVGNFN